MEDKLNLIKRYEKGEKVSVIAHALELPRSTVSTIIHDRERILAYVTEKAPSAKTAVMNVKRVQIFDEMERFLSLWIECQTHEHIQTSQLLIQEKAKSLFQDLLNKYPKDKDTTFVASSGWFARFKRRFSLHNVKIQGEAAAADTVAAEEFPASLKKKEIHRSRNAERTILTEKKKRTIQGTLDQFLLNVEKHKTSTSFDESPKKPRI
uniref:tigger transposable element-derived protein 1-like n=1 Tax=Myxine glutinosa TaxID=7769 RepID=UPI00358EB093